MYLYLIVLIRTSLRFLWSFIFLKEQAHRVSKHWFWADKEEIAVRQDSCHPSSHLSSPAWRSKGALPSLWQCLSVSRPRLWFQALCSILCTWLAGPISLCDSKSPSMLLLPLTEFGQKKNKTQPCLSVSNHGMTFPFPVLSYLFSMHNWSASGYLSWLKNLVGIVEI